MCNKKINKILFVSFVSLVCSTGAVATSIDQAAAERAKTLYDALAVEHTPIDIVKYYAAYKSNELAADEKFLGHWNMFVGTVSGVSKDLDGRAYIKLVADDYGVSSVKIYPSPKQLRRDVNGVVRHDPTESSLMTLSTGTSLSLQCKGARNEYNKPILKECLFWNYQQLLSIMKSQ